MLRVSEAQYATLDARFSEDFAELLAEAEDEKEEMIGRRGLS